MHARACLPFPSSPIALFTRCTQAEFAAAADRTSSLAAKHADEFLPYGTNYQLKEEMEAKAK